MKSNLHKLFGTSRELEKEGKKVPVGDGVFIFIRRFGGANAQRLKDAMAKHYKPFAKQMQSGQGLPEEVERELSAKIFVETCVANWEGVKDEDGNDIEFSLQTATDMFKELPDLVESLMAQANDFATFKEDLGNS